jgi:hypothetical protein
MAEQFCILDCDTKNLPGLRSKANAPLARKTLLFDNCILVNEKHIERYEWIVLMFFPEGFDLQDGLSSGSQKCGIFRRSS